MTEKLTYEELDSLLDKYMALVKVIEGTTFIHNWDMMEDWKFTKAEHARLELADDRVMRGETGL